ncbi:MAG: nicotinamide mononucleotide deamidase-related protein [Thermoprotei archaeon]|nr:nicotinamide mononucleotide deamidase-related protein [Thermoprotei archaeon]
MENLNYDVWILTVGNELLIGRVVNTNASQLGKMLTLMGFRVSRIIVVPDDIEEIVEEVRRATGRVRLLVTTGGLGPTYDDLTLEAIARALNRQLKVNPEAEAMIREFYSRRGMPMTRERLKMAVMPEGAMALKNPIGAAPGCVVEEGGTIIISLPGVPEEMEAMFKSEAAKILERIAPQISIVECSLTIKGVPESTIAPAIESTAKKHPEVYVKSHPKGFELGAPVLDVRALASDVDRGSAEAAALEALAYIKQEVVRLGGSTDEARCG